ncbi:hypothetical protein [Flavobacterium flavipallidum]|uniref:Uncharacterized protein n=1 Tax=Flavobacterium flavipallidum TaxID=3139140 RepID=A0ABU9HJU2_9FLAO
MIEKINSYSSDIIYSDRAYVQDKISHFFSFLNNQPISKRILDRIIDDFSILKNELPPTRNNVILDPRIKRSIKLSIKNREEQGAFGFFIIQELSDQETKFENHYLYAPANWYDGITGDYNKRLECLIENFFKPFIDLLEWYIYESQSKSDKDYYSKNEITIIIDRLNEIQLKQDLSNEIIFNEVDELKELILFLNKKNWSEILKGKFRDLILGEVITSENAKAVYKYLLENNPLLLK